MFMACNRSRIWKCSCLKLLVILVTSHETSLAQQAHKPGDNRELSLRELVQYGSDRTDLQALVQFKSQLRDDPDGALGSWDSSDEDPCFWYGVTCSASKRVIKLELVNTSLQGPIMLSTLVQMDMLELLNLSGNSFHGNLASIFDTKSRNSWGNLQAVVLSKNNLAGNLPQSTFLNCGSLQLLDLSHNHITGNLPYGISRCLTLQALDLSFNLLGGELPLDILSICGSEDGCSSNDPRPSLQVLDLSHNSLNGPIPDKIFSHCESLTSIDFSSNGFTGQIPHSLGVCGSMQRLNFSNNKLEGPIPESTGRLSSVETLDFSKNRIAGPMPAELAMTCATLVQLDLSSNNISGTVPFSFTSCASLEYLNLAKNNLSGSFPGSTVSQMRSLQILLLSSNQFSGPFPTELTHCHSLKVLELGSNKLSSVLPAAFCNPSFSLERLSLPNNDFHGEIPPTIANCSHLKLLDLSFNRLQGPIPPQLGSIFSLETIFMWHNRLTGQIPHEIGRLLNLKNLVLNNNQLSSAIPLELSNCTAMEWLHLSNNYLTGTIPAFLGNMQQLTILEIANNSLSGNIPLALANVSKFLWVDMNSNYLSGPIPPGLGHHLNGRAGRLTGTVYTFIRYLGNGCQGLGTLLEFSGITEDALTSTPFKTLCPSRTYMDESLNHDSDYSSIHYLDLSYNQLEGNIPDDMGHLGALLMLSLAHNQLVGSIPSSFSNLRSLGVLDLSYNRLEGGLGPLASCSFLVQIDVSNNNLSGSIPSSGQLSTSPEASYANNSALCGEPLPLCGTLNGIRSEDCMHGSACVRHNHLGLLPGTNIIVLGILVSVVFMCMLIVWAVMWRVRGKQKGTDTVLNNFTLELASCQKEPLSINVATFERPLRKLTFTQLIEATNGFSQENLIGIGGFGEVYKAELKDGTVVAIKKLLRFSYQGDREFTAEMETLGKIKHRHLVPLLGYCKVEEERLLIYEYMHCGSLDDMLHGEDRDRKERLTWGLRKQIARGAAKGLSFLHHNCIPHIIHRDMKSSNVLLDRNLEARVSDFGMARLISALDTHLSVTTLAGTPGYVPPEYYQSFRCTTRGDIYSFGVTLLELLTGRRPTDKEEFGDSNLVGWVRQHVNQKKGLEVLDPALLRRANNAGDQNEMLEYLRVGCDCVEEQPSKRPTMLQVVSRFKELQVNEGDHSS